MATTKAAHIRLLRDLQREVTVSSQRYETGNNMKMKTWITECEKNQESIKRREAKTFNKWVTSSEDPPVGKLVPVLVPRQGSTRVEFKMQRRRHFQWRHKKTSWRHHLIQEVSLIFVLGDSSSICVSWWDEDMEGHHQERLRCNNHFGLRLWKCKFWTPSVLVT